MPTIEVLRKQPFENIEKLFFAIEPIMDRFTDPELIQCAKDIVKVYGEMIEEVFEE